MEEQNGALVGGICEAGGTCIDLGVNSQVLKSDLHSRNLESRPAHNEHILRSKREFGCEGGGGEGSDIDRARIAKLGMPL